MIEIHQYSKSVIYRYPLRELGPPKPDVHLSIRPLIYWCRILILALPFFEWGRVSTNAMAVPTGSMLALRPAVDGDFKNGCQYLFSYSTPTNWQSYSTRRPRALPRHIVVYGFPLPFTDTMLFSGNPIYIISSLQAHHLFSLRYCRVCGIASYPSRWQSIFQCGVI